LIIKKIIKYLICFSIIYLPTVAAGQLSEYEMKAIFLERFTRFIEWPEEGRPDSTSETFILGVIGKNPFGSILDEIYSDQKIKNKAVEIRYISNMEEITGCHLLFIARSKKQKLQGILSFINEKPILTVSDTKGFAQKGVHINLYRKKDGTGFEINLSAALRTGFKISHLLLNIAKIVKEEK